MIVWRGKGWLVPWIPLLALLAAGWISNQVSPGYNRTHGWHLSLALLLAGCGLLAAGLSLNKGIPRLVRGPQFAGDHHFMNIRVEYWGALVALASIIPLTGD